MRESESFSNWPYFPRFWNTEVEMKKGREARDVSKQT